MRLANADVLPIDFNAFYKTVNDYAAEVKTLLDNMRAETDMQNRMIKDRLFDLATDPGKPWKAPMAKEPVPFLNFSSLDNSLTMLKTATEKYHQLYAKASQLPLEKQQQLNTVLYKAERSLLQEKGLPRRPWYRHQIYAPGYYTGYGVKTLPGIREGIEERHWQEVQENIDAVSRTLDAYTVQVKASNDLLK